MKKLLQLCAFSLLLAFSANAQLADDSFAPNWTLKDINGNSHTLYNYLDSGYTVIIDVSATWCGPCWNYHNSGALEGLYHDYGPGTADNKVRVFFIEGDVATTSDNLRGIGSNTLGDWITGTPYPIIDLTSSTSSFNTNYKISYFPTVYAVCPNRQLFEIGQQSTAGLWSGLNSYCGNKIATTNNDPAIIGYSGNIDDCKTPVVKLKLQNMGKEVLTAASFTAEAAGLTPLVYNWTGSLAPYATADINMGTMPITKNTALTVKITTADDNTLNNTVERNILYGKLSQSKTAVVKVATDRLGAQTTWKITSNGVKLKEGGPYTNQNAPGVYPQADVTFNLPFNNCYKVEVFDSGNNGMTGANGNGYVRVEDLTGQELVSIDQFTASAYGIFKKDATSSNEELEPSVAGIFPNPSTGVFTVVSTQHDLEMSVQNFMGQTITVKNNANGGNYEFDLSNYPAGTYLLKVRNGAQLETHKMILVK